MSSSRKSKTNETYGAVGLANSKSTGSNSSSGSAKEALLKLDHLKDNTVDTNIANAGVADTMDSRSQTRQKRSSVENLSTKDRTTEVQTVETDDNNYYSDGLIAEDDGLFRGAVATMTSSFRGLASLTENNVVQSPMSDDDDSDGSSDSEEEDEDPEMTIEELIYSSSSYYAIAKPVSITMVAAALSVVYVNTDDTIAYGEEAMSVYQVWSLNSNSSSSANLIMSLANALVMVSFICMMTFGVVLLYRFKCMKILIGYMMCTSAMLLGVLGSNLFTTLFTIYEIPIDMITFYIFMYNFAFVGVYSVFFGQGIPKFIVQFYLIATSVILAWHLSYFDDYTTWTLLFMLAVYDLCAVLTPCGPLKALVNLMSKDDAPDMPGLLYEAELPPEAKRPSNNSNNNKITSASPPDNRIPSSSSSTAAHVPDVGSSSGLGGGKSGVDNVDLLSDPQSATLVEDVTSSDPVRLEEIGNHMKIPLAIAKVYQLPVISIPDASKNILNPDTNTDSNVSASPLLVENRMYNESSVILPESPTPEQLRALVIVRLPSNGGKLEQVSKRGKKVYLESDRHGNPKRILWVDRKGKVFAEMKDDDEDAPERNSIRLGLGDFIFYSVLVAKAAQYSFTTFAACMLVILAGLGGTLVLLSVYHHALPALPISIFLGVIFYLMTRLFIEPWIESILTQPYYV